MIKTSYINILETGSLSFVSGGEDPSYPLYRLYDRNIGRPFKASGTGITRIRIDQGASPIAVDSLLIPSGHNLDGMTLDILYSDNGADFTLAVPRWVQSGNGLIEKSWTSITKRYWDFAITSASVIPQLTELFLTQTYGWQRNPSRPSGPFDPMFNVERKESSGGQIKYLIHGDAKRQRLYHMPRCTEAMKGNIVSLNEAWQGAKPFWLYDHEGNWIYGELRDAIKIKEEAYQAYSFDFDFLEVIP